MTRANMYLKMWLSESKLPCIKQHYLGMADIYMRRTHLILQQTVRTMYLCVFLLLGDIKEITSVVSEAIGVNGVIPEINLVLEAKI